MRSMTGFASVQGAHKVWTWTADIRSVNGKGLDVRLRMPDWIEGLEPLVRKAMQAKLTRGNVTLNLKVQREEEAAGAYVNKAGLKAALAAVAKIETAASLEGMPLAPIRATDIAAMRGVIDFSENVVEGDIAALRTAILADITDCLDAFDADRAREGAALEEVLTAQLGEMTTLTEAAAKAAGAREAATRAGIDRGLARLLKATEVPDEGRLLQELALIAVKADITEEIDRLRAHVEAAKELIGSDVAMGRKFDFLMQEFNREANTLCSKSQATDLTAIGLDLKALIDQMREQVQNVE
ncbi:MAG: YicC/YloC family endoribonuclease [Paracoccaceae bacterium]